MNSKQFWKLLNESSQQTDWRLIEATVEILIAHVDTVPFYLRGYARWRIRRLRKRMRLLHGLTLF